MAAATRKFTLPNVEELDEEKQLTRTKPLFKASKISSGDCHSLEEEAVRKGKTFNGSKIACTQGNEKRSSKTNFVITEPGSSEMKNLPTERIFPNAEPSSRDFPVTSTDVSSSTQMACTVSNEIKTTVGKTFRETFAFLEGTSHYKETVAKIKEKELSKPVKESVPFGGSKPKSNAIIVNPRQKGNPVLKHVRSVPWELGDIIPDYELGATTCALFLSLKYHNHYPEYIHERLKILGQRYELRILLVLVDVPDPYQTLRELAKMAVMADCTLILSWSAEEAGRYLETYKVYENKPPDALMGQSEGDYFTKLSECLTTVKGINKTDCVSLGSTFGSLANMVKVSKEDLAFLPGFGPLKAQRLHDLFNEPFIAKRKAQGQPKEEATDTSKNGSGL